MKLISFLINANLNQNWSIDRPIGLKGVIKAYSSLSSLTRINFPVINHATCLIVPGTIHLLLWWEFINGIFQTFLTFLFSSIFSFVSTALATLKNTKRNIQEDWQLHDESSEWINGIHHGASTKKKKKKKRVWTFPIVFKLLY